MLLDVRTILLLFHPDGKQLLLLRRSPGKKLFPNLITGIGGKVELEWGEAIDLESAALRELQEETRIPVATLSNLSLRLSTHLVRDDQLVLLLWFTAQLTQLPPDLFSPDGQLEFHDRDNLPLDRMVPTARQAISFVAALHEADRKNYTGTYGPDQVSLIVSL